MEGRYPNARRSSVAVCIILLAIVKVNIMIPRSSWTILGSFLALCIGTFAMAEDLQVLTGPAILTISGDIEQLEGAALMALSATTFETSTIWTDDVHSFTGVSLQTLALEMGVSDGWFLATAINDYSVKIPMSDAVEGGPIVAYLMNGEEMSIRDKGPLWVIYPYDSDADFRSEVVFTRSIWQLDRLVVIR
jgi:hypothetical protein